MSGYGPALAEALGEADGVMTAVAFGVGVKVAPGVKNVWFE